MECGPEIRSYRPCPCAGNPHSSTFLRYGLDAKGLGLTHLNLSVDLIGGTPYESGALFSFAGKPSEVTLRVGVSFLSTAQACANAETEIGGTSFEQVEAQSKALWNEKLSKVEIDVPNTPPNVTEMLYSSLYRAALTPVGSRLRFFPCNRFTKSTQNNATGEAQGVFENATSFCFDSLYCR